MLKSVRIGASTYGKAGIHGFTGATMLSARLWSPTKMRGSSTTRLSPFMIIFRLRSSKGHRFTPALSARRNVFRIGCEGPRPLDFASSRMADAPVYMQYPIRYVIFSRPNVDSSKRTSFSILFDASTQ